MALTAPPLNVRQKLILAVIVTVAAALRLESLGQTSLAHFDEGVLAANAFSVWEKGLLKFQLAMPLQAPPLFPWLVAAAHALLHSDWVILGKFVSAGMGTATVPLVFALARRLKDAQFGLAAAAIFAGSDLHVAYSRMELTDAPLTFFFTLSIYCVLRLYDAASWPALAAPQKSRSGGEPASVRRRKLIGALIGWSVAAGLTTGAAWTTKYNGWMSLAAALTALALVGLRDSLWRTHGRKSPPAAFWRVAIACAVAAIIAGCCFAPWVWFVNRAFAGGYAAVTANHWSYFGGPAAWPGRAWRLCLSLPAFRHYGWLLTTAAIALAIGRFAFETRRQPNVESSPRAGVGSLIVALAGLLGAFVLGTDTLAFLLAIAAIAPALAYGRFEHVLLAVWLGAFVVMIPFYNPYTRLLTPALPAAVLLSLWLLDASWGALKSRVSTHEGADLQPPARLARALGALAVAACLAIFFAAHPFGWFPSAALWRRWSTHESYRSFGLAIDDHTPADAFVLCQGLPPMPLYCPREWRALDLLPFTALLDRAPADRPCYLAVDDWGAHAAGHDAARKTLLANRACLDPVVSTPNDLNIVALLDNLSPDEVAEKLAREPPAGEAESAAGANFPPPGLQEMKPDVIVLYRIDRQCVDSRTSP